jgi:hypothetical protein
MKQIKIANLDDFDCPHPRIFYQLSFCSLKDDFIGASSMFTIRKPYLVWGSFHATVCGERPKIHDFLKIAGDV